MLGLHESKGGYAPGNFIGLVWIGGGESRAVLRVDSKFSEMNYIRMFAECAAHPVIGARLGKCLRFWADEELIPIPKSPDFLELAAAAYLRELNELCRRHLRRHFLRARENFTGKVKGKILINENLRRNITRCRPDRVFCEYQSVSDDILENRILRAALERAARFVSSSCIGEKNNAIMRQWIRASRAALQGVSVAPVKRADFAAARKRGAFAFYRAPLELAKIVLLQLGFNPHEEIPQHAKTPPFALDSAELFERYAELQLLKTYPGLKALYNDRQNIGSGADDFVRRVRPDFYIPSAEGETPQIIDAKYKDNLINKQQPEQEDVFQIIAYSRHRGVLRKINCAENGAVELSLVYPFFGGGGDVEEYKTSDAYSRRLHFYKIKCPAKDAAG
ncbi:MAG: 5-methylcytosine restriction system specificity protein McrC [Gammaproteobacteria bacterium]